MTHSKLLLNGVGLILAATILSGCEALRGQEASSDKRVVTILIKKVPGLDDTVLLDIPGITEIDCKGTEPVRMQFVLTGALSGKFAANSSIIIHGGASVFEAINLSPQNDHLITAEDNCSDTEHYFKYDVHVATDKGEVVADPLLKNY